MAIITEKDLQPTYDVIVVGSGAGGGQSAYTLTMNGVKVLMLEAGRNYDPVTETPMFQTHAQMPLRGMSTKEKPFGFVDATVDGGWNVPGEPYTQASDNPDERFMWWRPRMLGGRTNHWGRISLRNGPYDFKPHSRDGLGVDWPIGYDDVAPYYDKVEMLIGVYGSNEGLENTPDSPNGTLLPPPKARAGELYVKKHIAKFGMPVIPIHRAILSTRQDHLNFPARLHPNNPKAQKIIAKAMQERAACFWATDCGRGCAIKANYQSTTVHLPPALATGNLDILCNAHAREVTVDAAGKANGVIYIDKATGQERAVKARAVVLAASSAESSRILLNSKSSRYPQGLANTSGEVGKNIMDTVGTGLGGHMPAFEGLPVHNEEGAGTHVYIPWWLYKDASKLGFARGYHIEFGTGRRMPSLGAGGASPGYGKSYKEEVRRTYGAGIGFSGRGEMIPNKDSFCDIDPVVKDKFGIPVLRFHWKWSEHETRQAAHMEATFAMIIEAMGGKCNKPETDGNKAIEPPGSIIHEVGGTIMGADRKTSVTNQWNQCWDVPNLLVNDGGPFCSNADKNPTLTIMALAWRASDHLIEEMRKGNI
ncbi:MAG: GMC family oxidoreductase [Verrucomicrobia bacterium]|nr:GMC family oxidoreductase [Verrucomicrobiota bacterium]